MADRLVHIVFFFYEHRGLSPKRNYTKNVLGYPCPVKSVKNSKEIQLGILSKKVIPKGSL